VIEENWLLKVARNFSRRSGRPNHNFALDYTHIHTHTGNNGYSAAGGRRISHPPKSRTGTNQANQGGGLRCQIVVETEQNHVDTKDDFLKAAA